MATVTENLQQLGFSDYEARAYVTLLQHHPANGYMLAKESGIPRANVYSVLQKLEERGAVFAIDTQDGTAYSPTPPDELIRRLSSRFENVLGAARQSLADVAKPVEQTYVQNVQGYTQLLNHARDLVQQAQHHLLIAVWNSEAQLLADDIAQAQMRGVAITTLCLQACPQECGGCQGHILRYHVSPPESARWLIVIRDETDMVMGTTGAQSAAIRTRQTSLIEMATWYIRHSLTLAAVLSDLGDRLEETLQPQTRDLLQVIGQGSSWLDYMLHLIQR